MADTFTLEVAGYYNADACESAARNLAAIEHDLNVLAQDADENYRREREANEDGDTVLATWYAAQRDMLARERNRLEFHKVRAEDHYRMLARHRDGIVAMLMTLNEAAQTQRDLDEMERRAKTQ